ISCRAKFKMSEILVLGLLLATPSCLAYSEDLANCFQDPDYESFLVTAQEGLHTSPLPNCVVVVGPGMSGLVAAKTLQDAGHHVTILEASDHIGGRVVTFRNEEEGWYYDLGPTRIPKSHSLVYTYVKKFGLKLNKFIHWEVKANPDLLGYSVSPTEKGKSAMNLFYESIDKVLKMFNCSHLMSFYDSYSTKVSEAKKPQNGSKARGPRSASHPHCPIHPCSFFKVTGGFDQLPKALSASLKPGTLHLRSKVEAVVRDGPQVRVSYRADLPAWAQCTLTADYVVVSASAKAMCLIAFQPPPSTDKIDALRSVHYTGTTKMVLACDQRFWEWDGCIPMGIRGGVSITDQPSRYIIYPSRSLPDGKGVLLASYNLDDDSLFFTALKHDQVVDIVLNNLATVHQIPKEELWRMCPSSVVKKWSLDSLAMGTFADFTPYQFVHYWEQLSQPEGRIHFTGEHTGLPHGWMDTAVKTGLRAARNIQAAVDQEAMVGQGQKPFTNRQKGS
uniref:Amine oxidase n=1 Tax=Theropithecus gelada TaxID=9565 RepID=A0A8D2G2P2_THEGE